MKFQTPRFFVAAVFSPCAGLATSERRGCFLKQTSSTLLLSLMVLGAFGFAAGGQSVYPTAYSFSTLAGSAGQIGSADGTGSAARFFYPAFVTVDSAGTVYVTDGWNHTIRKVTSGGVVTTLAGSAGQSGSVDGTNSAARFNHPEGLAVDSAGYVYVVDYGNDTIRKITPAGAVTTLAGSAGQTGSADGTGGAARFNLPIALAVDTSGYVYVADTYNHTIRKITPAGAVTTLAGSAGQSGSADGTGSAARFYYPEGAAVDSAGNIYVGDALNNTIRKITPAGVVTTLAGSAGQIGSADGVGSATRFNHPDGVAVGSADSIFVADYGNDMIRKITPVGAVTTLAGSAGQIGSADGIGSAARFYLPQSAVVDSGENVYVADTYNHTIRKGVPCITLTCPTNKTASCGAAWSFDPPTATNSCYGTNLTLTILTTTTNSGPCPTVITRTWSATDQTGYSNTCSQTVTVVDTTPPLITGFPAGVSLGCNPAAASLPTDASVKALVTATDSCGLSATNVTHVDGGTACASNRTFTITVTDACTNTVSTNVVYTWTVNTLPPVLACVPDKTVQCGSPWTFDPPSATNACCGTNLTVAVLSTVTNGVCPQVITRTWQATDCCTNSATCSQTVTVASPPPYYEPFSYTVGANLGGQTNPSLLTWADAGTSTAGPYITIQSNNLSVTGLLPSTGNSIQFGGLGKSARFSFPTGGFTNGTVYYSFALRVTDSTGLGASGGFIAGFNNTVGTQTAQPSVVGTRLYMRSTNDGFNLGLSKNSSTATDWVWEPTRHTNDDIFIVGSYTFSSGSSTDDVSQLWINPNPADFGGSNPPPPSLTASAGADLSTVASFVLFQRSSTIEAAAMVADELRFASTWAGVTPPAPSYTVNIHTDLNLIANQLDHGSNSLNEILSPGNLGTNGQDGLVLFKYNNDGGTWTVSAYSATSGSWTPGDLTLRPGEGAFLQSPSDFSLVIHGTPHVPVLPLTIPAGASYLLSRQTNDLGTFTKIVGLPPNNGAKVYQWTGSNYNQFNFSSGAWSPSEPTAAVGEAVWISPAGSGGPLLPPPFITQQPASLTVTQGQSAPLTVAASGTPPLIYTWHHQCGSGDPNYPDCLCPTCPALASITLSNVQPSQGGEYYVVVSNSYGSVTSTVSILAVVPPSLSYDVTIRTGWNLIANQLDHGSNTFNEILNSGNLGTNGQDGLVLYKYNNGSGTWTVSGYSAALGAWTPGDLTLSPGEGAFLQSPSDFSLVIHGTPHVPVLPLTIPAGASYLLSRQTNDIGTFTNIVGFPPTNGATVYKWSGSNYITFSFASGAWSPSEPTAAMGEAVWISPAGSGGPLLPTPLITQQPVSLAVTQGQSATLTLVASGTPPLMYTWHHNCGSGDPNYPDCLCPMCPALASITLSNVQPNQSGGYYVVVSNSYGSATSVVATLTVLEPSSGCVPPLITQAGFLTNGFSLSFQSLPAFTYLIEYKTSLNAPAWTVLRSVLATSSLTTEQDALATGQSRFYRVVCQGPLTGPATPYEPPAAPVGSPSGCSATGCNGGAQNPSLPYLSSGEFHQETTDLAIKGRGINFDWTRSYRSKLGPNTAQGNGWDFSYNIQAVPNGTGFDVYNGGGRKDAYHLLSGGTYGADQIFCEGTLSNNAFQLEFPDSGTWTFVPFNGSSSQGKLDRITDRNGNALAFTYSASGLLTNVTDTLGRNIQVGYNADGLVSSLTDFAGRQLTYAYYQNGNAGGAFGDLKSVTSPAVTGTPNGNDFPSGKTVTYTYSKGYADEGLNHKLLTITDAKNQIWLRNTYSQTTNTTDFNYGRLLAQARGYSNEVRAFYYQALVPASSNQFAVTKAIVNDPEGNVSEHLFGWKNDLLRFRQFTGHAVSGVPTTDTQNRPASKLRASDPDFFETRYEWNADSQRTLTVYPNGNSVVNTYQLAVDPSASCRARGNLLARTTLAGPLGGDQAAVTETFVYASGQAGCGCGGYNFVTQATDPHGNTTFRTYDTNGNLTSTIQPISSSGENFEYNQHGQMTAQILADNGSGYRQRNVFSYYTNGPQAGYVRQQIVDAQTLGQTTTFEYDVVGNAVRAIDSNGKDVLSTVNALNQTVRTVSQEVSAGSGIRYTNDFFYDGNNNRVRVDVQNINDQGIVSPANPVFTTTYEYDILNLPVRSTQPASSNHVVVTELVYNAKHQAILARSGQAVSGADPFNTVTSKFDERDLLYQEIRAEGSATQTTTQYDYDLNGNVTRKSVGLENTPHIEISHSDGFGRLTNSIDAMGNVRTLHYDAGGNLLSERIDGELTDIPGSAGNVRLKEITYGYDPMNRRIRSDEAFFDAKTQAPIGSGLATTLTFYNDASQIVAVIDANGHTNRTSYDSAGRVSVQTDPKGNTATYTYDPKGNVITLTAVTKSDLGNSDRTFTKTMKYDGADRAVQVIDNLGNTNQTSYDSKNLVLSVRNARGNVRSFSYDGLARQLQRSVTLTTTGAGDGSPIGAITTLQTWDDSGRLTSQSDANSNTTAYSYDSQNRRIRTLYADGSADSATYDVYGNRVSATDANSNVVTSVYDMNNRLVTNIVSRGLGILGTTFEHYQYDGLSRLILAENDQSVVTRDYDSLGHVTRETQGLLPGGASNVVTSVCDALGNQTRLSYPGGRVIERTFEALDRLAQVRDQSGPIVATYSYVGPDTERRDYGNGTRFQPAYDGLFRIINTAHSRIAGGALLDHRAYTWDARGNVTTADDLLSSADVRTFSYDSGDRMVHSLTAISGPVTDYTLDGAGNRQTVSGGADAGGYFMDSASPVPQDFQANRYTTTPFDARSYDPKGNLVVAGARQYTYDYRNHLLHFTDTGSSEAGDYLYDVLGRRIAKTTAGTTTRFFYNDNQEIEEQDAGGVTLATYVWGNDLDEILQMSRGGQAYFYHADHLGSVRKITDAAGSVVEAYTYSDYGLPHFLDGSGNSLSGTQIGNATLFTGRRFDPELGWYYYRTRYLDPRAGRFVTSDSVGMWQDPAALGNGFTYVGNNPLSYSDPMGTGWWAKLKAAAKAVVNAVVQVVDPTPIVGVAADGNVCADFVTGEWTVDATYWAGIGGTLAGQWFGFDTKGAYSKGGNDSRLIWFKSNNATCATCCSSTWLGLGGKIKFPKGSTEVNRGVKVGPLSCDLQATFNNTTECSATVSANCEYDLLPLLGTKANDFISQAATKTGISFEVSATGSLSFSACATTSGVKATSAKGCIGAKIRIGLNVDDHP